MGLVDLTLPAGDLSYWLKLGPLLTAFFGFPIFAFFRHSRIRNNIDRRFDEMPGMFDLDGDPMLEHLEKTTGERSD
jgi:hypothetical protein